MAGIGLKARTIRRMLIKPVQQMVHGMAKRVHRGVSAGEEVKGRLAQHHVAHHVQLFLAAQQNGQHVHGKLVFVELTGFHLGN